MNELFVVLLMAVLGLMFTWGFKTLPKEKWQILACIPHLKKENGGWTGENITYYGLFNANAYTLGAAIFILMMGSVNAPLTGVGTVLFLLLGICLPASSWVARIVEKKRYTLTVGGASFVGIIIAPFVVNGVNMSIGSWLGFEINGLIFLAAVSVAYAFGEGTGRLACISFGCCYGKPVSQCSPVLQKIFKKCNFIFSGKTKKIAYADQLDNKEIVPVQAITSIIYCTAGLAGIYLFLKGYYAASFIETIVITQLWRVFSEYLRSDYRGESKFSAYQKMGIIAVVYGVASGLFYDGGTNLPALPQLLDGLKHFWNPAVLLGLEGLWLFTFVYTGRSKVTGSLLSLHVIRDRV